ncbi:MAG: type II toxin-antitoxin system RelE/ParE family toxin [Candidatus Pacearchaeota archaeon]|nr:type II toxin-antitoxin system RelE/ParE family toxin [Candidatus Pacearchaeota archaeon]
MYKIEVSELADKKFYKIARKNKVLFESISKKIEELKFNPEHFKPLRGSMKGERRIHFGPFVMTFEIDYKRGVVRILDFDHHDKAYKE